VDIPNNSKNSNPDAIVGISAKVEELVIEVYRATPWANVGDTLIDSCKYTNAWDELAGKNLVDDDVDDEDEEEVNVVVLLILDEVNVVIESILFK